MPHLRSLVLPLFWLTALLGSSANALAQEADTPAATTVRPESVVLARNFAPGGATPYDFEVDTITARAVSPVADGVRVTFADGHETVVPSSGEVVLEVLRNGHDAVAKNTFRDAMAASCLVQATPEEVNEAVRDVATYPSWFNKREEYCHTYYTKGEILDRAKHPQQAQTLAANEKATGASLAQHGYEVGTPESNLLQLALVVGKCNTFVKSTAEPALLTTCYRVGRGGEPVAIINENSLAWPDKEGGAKIQNVVWIIEPVEGKGTLVRYIYASEIESGKAAFVVDERWKMAQKNVTEFVGGIRDLAVHIKQGGGAKVERQK